MNDTNDILFKSSKIGNFQISNALVVAPMTRVSGLKDGSVGPLMQDYYANFAKGGFGLIISEGLYPDTLYSQCYQMQPGLATEIHAKSWRPVVDAVHKQGSLFVAQIMHAGALAQNIRAGDKNISPSAVKPKGQQMSFYYGNGDYSTPEAMTEDDIKDVVAHFASSALLAKSAGFDGVEIHGANGYLLDQFLTRHTNKRDDQYGGSIENRLRIHREIIEAMRDAVGEDFIIGIRFSQAKVNDATHKWVEGVSFAEEVFKIIGMCQIDYIHTTEPVLSESAFDKGLSLAAIAKKYSGLPVIANGGINAPTEARQALENGHGDLIALGKIALSNQDWPKRAMSSENIQDFDFSMLMPIANLENGSTFLSRKLEPTYSRSA
ncbi:MAG: NADH:flavin oxidoreductase [Sneathiella sp.]